MSVLDPTSQDSPAVFDALVSSAGCSAKFRDPERTADGQPRAHVDWIRLETLWFCTGTLCNLACRNCYIESSPRNDRLAYITVAEVATYLDEIERERLGTATIAFTGGEPFMNPQMVAILEEVLRRGFRAFVLTNAMRPMMKCRPGLLDLLERYGESLSLRVSADHFLPEVHEAERGPRSWKPMLQGLAWLTGCGFEVAVAGRRAFGASETETRAGFQALFAAQGIPLDAHDPSRLVLFPEMDPQRDVPEISESCWSKLGRQPSEMMCATSRMVIKRKGDAEPVVVPCTLLPYQPEMELGRTLVSSFRRVSLNHPHCAQFCVLGGASCSG